MENGKFKKDDKALDWRGLIIDFCRRWAFRKGTVDAIIEGRHSGIFHELREEVRSLEKIESEIKVNTYWPTGWEEHPEGIRVLNRIERIYRREIGKKIVNLDRLKGIADYAREKVHKYDPRHP